MSSSEKRTVIIIQRPLWKSLLLNAYTFALLAGLIGIGVLVGSAAMQWSGFVLGFIVLFGRAMKADPPMTITEARKRLDELQAAEPQP